MLPADFQLSVKPESGENMASLVDTKYRNIGSLLNQELLARSTILHTLTRRSRRTKTRRSRTTRTSTY